jgi:hypothetical protein
MVIVVGVGVVLLFWLPFPAVVAAEEKIWVWTDQL